jgi:hypothetical protein
MDTAPYSSAHPDDILVVAGPPRLDSVNLGATSGVGSLLAVGQLQQASLSAQIPVQMSKALGSTRKFFLKDTAMYQIMIARLVMNGRNLVRALYHSAVEAGIDVGDPAEIGTPASYSGRENQQFWVNFDSPIYRLPVGLGFLMRDRGGSHIGGIYCEVTHLQSWQLAFSSGQSAVVENCSFMCDTMREFGDSKTVGALAMLFDEALDLVNNTIEEKIRAGEDDDVD